MRAPVLIPLMLLAACESGSSVEQTANAGAEANAIAAMAATSSELTTLKAADGTVLGANHAAAEQPRALILLFHQAGSSKEEYAAIQPRLKAAGFSSLAIDQRVGGDLFGGNQTARIAKVEDYRLAKPDLEAALAWAKDKGLPVILWGSSYSASLAFVVAAENPGAVAAVMAFSPGEYFDGNPSIREAAAKVKVPVFVTSSAEAKEVSEARAILAAVPAAEKVQFVPEQGVHGSSILLAERNAAGAEAAWTAVLEFLGKVAPAR